MILSDVLSAEDLAELDAASRGESAGSYQLLPPLSEDEFAELVADIAEHGIEQAIVVDEHGVVIDGHHRQQIADELGIECPSVVRSGLSDEQKRSLALRLNLHRRHLSREQKRELVARSLKADPGLSDREHGRRTGVSKNTAAAIRGDLEEGGQIDHHATRIGADGVAQPATKPKREPATTPNPEPETDTQPTVCDECEEESGDLTEVDGGGYFVCADCAHKETAVVDVLPPKRKRPLVELVADLAVQARKVSERIARQAEDKRFAANREAIARNNLPDLKSAVSNLNGLINSLEGL